MEVGIEACVWSKQLSAVAKASGAEASCGTEGQQSAMAASARAITPPAHPSSHTVKISASHDKKNNTRRASCSLGSQVQRSCADGAPRPRTPRAPQAGRGPRVLRRRMLQFLDSTSHWGAHGPRVGGRQERRTNSPSATTNSAGHYKFARAWASRSSLLSQRVRLAWQSVSCVLPAVEVAASAESGCGKGMASATSSTVSAASKSESVAGHARRRLYKSRIWNNHGK